MIKNKRFSNKKLSRDNLLLVKDSFLVVDIAGHMN
jgi:hypothetical protein